MNKLNNQRKITHLAPKNPMKTDLMTENIHTRKLYEEAELKQKSKRLQFRDLRIIQEYFRPKIGRKIRIFSLGKKNILLQKHSLTPEPVNNDKTPVNDCINNYKWIFLRFLFQT